MRLLSILLSVALAGSLQAAPSADDLKEVIVEHFKRCGQASDYWRQEEFSRVSVTKERTTRVRFDKRTVHVDETLETKFMRDASGKNNAKAQWQTVIDLSLLEPKVTVDYATITLRCTKGKCLKVKTMAGGSADEGTFGSRDLHLCNPDAADRVGRSFSRLIKHYGGKSRR